MNIIWLGHSCFVAESAGWRVVLDPYYVETYPARQIGKPVYGRDGFNVPR